MLNPTDDFSAETVTRSEHIDPKTTGDNIQAKRVAPYNWDGTNWSRQPLPFLDKSYDYVGFSNADGNGNYQTIVFNSGGSGGTTLRTLSLTFDGNNNVTTITKT